MITILRLIEGLFCITNVSSAINVKSLLLEDKKNQGFPLNSDFGWTIQIDTNNSSNDIIEISSNTKSNRVEEVESQQEQIPDHVVNASQEKTGAIIAVRRTYSRIKPESPKYIPPLWEWPNSHLLEGLILWARDDPYASQALALDMIESDEEVRYRDMEKPRLDFLRQTGRHGVKLWIMTQEAKEMRKDVEKIKSEMEEEEVRARKLKKEILRLRSDILEVVCADDLLKKLGMHQKRKVMVMKGRELQEEKVNRKYTLTTWRREQVMRRINEARLKNKRC